MGRDSTRRCPGCGESKTQEAFSGTQSRCRSCRSALCKDWRKRHPDRQWASHLRWRASRPEWKPRLETGRRNAVTYRLAHADRTTARAALRNALRRGEMVKPSQCSVCPSSIRIEAHHDDYEKPLEVRWLCAACHQAHHIKHPENQ